MRWRQPQALGQQAAGFLALAMVGIAQVQRAFGHAVEAHQQMRAAAGVAPVRFYALRQGLDVAGVVVVAVDETQLGNMALGARPIVDRVKHAGRGRARVLRVQGQDQDARRAFGLERIEFAGNRRTAIAHGVAHQHVVPGLAQPAAQQQRLARGPMRQRRAVLGVPDRGVFRGRLRRARAQDDAVQDGPPGQLGNLHDAVVAEKLREVAAHGRRRGRIGRAEVAQQHGGACGAAVGGRGFWREA